MGKSETFVAAAWSSSVKPGDLVRINRNIRNETPETDTIQEGAVFMVVGPDAVFSRDVIYILTPFGPQSIHTCYLEPFDEAR